MTSERKATALAAKPEAATTTARAKAEAAKAKAKETVQQGAKKNTETNTKQIAKGKALHK